MLPNRRVINFGIRMLFSALGYLKYSYVQSVKETVSILSMNDTGSVFEIQNVLKRKQLFLLRVTTMYTYIIYALHVVSSSDKRRYCVLRFHELYNIK